MYNPIFNDEYLWKWMKAREQINGHDTLYSILIEAAKHQIDRNYIVEKRKALPSLSTSSLMCNLRRQMPEEYRLQVEFCLVHYAEIFGMFFPPLVSFVDELAYIEWLLYVEPGYEKYRDHLVHMFKVSCIALWFTSNNEFLDEVIHWQFGIPEHFKKWLSDRKFHVPSDQNIQNHIIKIALLIASLFHDFGYGYFFMRLFRTRISRLYQWQGDQECSNDPGPWCAGTFLESLCHSFLKDRYIWDDKNTRSQEKEIRERVKERVVAGCVSDQLGLKNHSMASSLFILDLNKSLVTARAIDNCLEIAFHLAAEAAMIHDLLSPENYGNIKKIKCQELLKKSPLAFILIIADELAFWNRFKYITKNSNDEVIFKIDPSGVPDGIEISIDCLKKEILIRPKAKPEDFAAILEKLTKVLKQDLQFKCKSKKEELLLSFR